MAPELITMNDFFYRLTSSAPADQVNLLLELYGVYRKINPSCESLDDFIFWGTVLLSDFNDVDKYLVRPEALFTNVSDFRKMQDSFSYLDGKQLKAIEQFISHFSTGGRYKEEFRRIWDILLPLYNEFGGTLRGKGLAYEGMVYREVAERLAEESVADVLAPAFPYVEKYVFVGLNALNECEKRLMSRMREAGIAEFCWDYSGEWIKDRNNRSSFFLSENVGRFGQDFAPDPEGLGKPRFNVLSVPSSVGQAKQLPGILERLGAQGIETAVVLPDEAMLVPVLNSIPEHMGDINVTMGYPMKSSALWSLMNDLSALQMHLREKGGKWYFYHRQFWSVFSNSIVRSLLDGEGAAAVEALRKEAQYYICEDSIPDIAVLKTMLRPVVKSPSAASADSIREIEEYQLSVLSSLASVLTGMEDMSVELDFAKEYYLAVGRLANYELPVLPATYLRLLDRLVSPVSVPFKGEPLRGLQIMGPLETRALDFRNVVILNCNEGIFPHRNVSSSFVPAELRRGFGLPTYEYQDAVWAYYFYRLVQRAENVWMLYDSRTEGVNTGEESRYIKQLEMHFEADVTRYFFNAPLASAAGQGEIPKLQSDIDELKKKYLSASALQDYLCCPARFYYARVKGLKAQEEIAESLDQSMIGNAFHKSMQELYSVPGGLLTAGCLNDVLKGGRIADVVERKILEELKAFELSGRNLIYEDVICRYVRQTIVRDIELMRSRNVDSIRILGLERVEKMRIGDYDFVGFIDRLDCLDDDTIRVVDYKTGKVRDEEIAITDENAEAVVGNLFGDSNASRPKIALQLYLYDRFVSGLAVARGRRILNSIYQPVKFFTEPVKNVVLCDRFTGLMDRELERLLDEISDLSVPFRRTAEANTCKYCDFKNLCGR